MSGCGKITRPPSPRAVALDPACVYEAGHEGCCREGSGVDALVADLTRTLLTTLGHPAHAVRTLNHADSVFGRLDLALRQGGPLPSGWKVTPEAREPAHVYADTLYDLVSETLRDTGGPPVCWKALRGAGSAWADLVQAMHEGSPLPEPWAREFMVG